MSDWWDKDPDHLSALDIARDGVDRLLQVVDEHRHHLIITAITRAVVTADHTRMRPLLIVARRITALQLGLVGERLRDAGVVVPDVAVLEERAPLLRAVDALVVIAHLECRVGAYRDLTLDEALEDDLERLELLGLGVRVKERAPLMRQEEHALPLCLADDVQLALCEQVLVRHPLVELEQVADLEAIHGIR